MGSTSPLRISTLFEIFKKLGRRRNAAPYKKRKAFFLMLRDIIYLFKQKINRFAYILKEKYKGMTDINRDKQSIDEQVNKKLAQLQSSPYYGTLLVYCILENIKNNDGDLTENAVVDIVRGMARKHEGFRNPAKYSGMFRLVKDETVRKVINWLKDCGVIRRCLVCGYYNDYYTLQIQDRILSDKILESFIVSELPVEKLGKEPLSDPEAMILLQNEDMIKKAGLPAYIEILNHPYVFCIERDRICSLFKEAPESAKDYLKSAANEKDAMKRKMVSMIKKCI